MYDKLAKFLLSIIKNKEVQEHIFVNNEEGVLIYTNGRFIFLNKNESFLEFTEYDVKTISIMEKEYELTDKNKRRNHTYLYITVNK